MFFVKMDLKPFIVSKTNIEKPEESLAEVIKLAPRQLKKVFNYSGSFCNLLTLNNLIEFIKEIFQRVLDRMTPPPAPGKMEIMKIEESIVT